MDTHPEKAEQILEPVKKDRHFRLHMGADVGSLLELKEALDIMSDTTFNHHVTQARNDFATWVNDVLDDGHLATQIRHVKTKPQMVKKIDARIRQLEKKATEGMPIHTRESMWIGARDFLIGLVVGLVAGFMIKNITMMFGF